MNWAVVLAKPEVKDAFGKLAFEVRSSTPQELTAFVAEQLEAYRRVARGGRPQPGLTALRRC